MFWRKKKKEPTYTVEWFPKGSRTGKVRSGVSLVRLARAERGTWSLTIRGLDGAVETRWFTSPPDVIETPEE